MLAELNDRSREIFTHIVDTFCETGEAIGSETLAKRMGMRLSSASIRAVMARLESMGLLYSPHTSAGRLPTETGIKLFVDGLLQVGSLDEKEQEHIEQHCQESQSNVPRLLDQAVSVLTGLTKCTGLVVAPKSDGTLKHIEFVSLGPGQALVILLSESGTVENRVISIPQGLPPSSLVEAGNYLNARLMGESMTTARSKIFKDLEEHRVLLNKQTQQVVEAGLGVWNEDETEGQGEGRLIVKGQSHLLNEVTHLDKLAHLKALFEELETKENLLRLLDASIEGEGVKIYIGAESTLFNLSGCSLVVSPYHNKKDKVIGAIGVVGPTHIHYARIVPMVDYTAKMISRLIAP